MLYHLHVIGSHPYQHAHRVIGSNPYQHEPETYVRIDKLKHIIQNRKSIKCQKVRWRLINVENDGSPVMRAHPLRIYCKHQLKQVCLEVLFEN